VDELDELDEVEDEVLEVLELDDVELEVVELDFVELEVEELEEVVDFVLLTELEVPTNQKSAFPISADLAKKWNKGRSLSSYVSKLHKMRKYCLRIWEHRIQEWEFPYLWSLMLMKIWSSLLRTQLTRYSWTNFGSLRSLTRLCWMLDDLSMAHWGRI
jgi:hypothetical protein